MTDTDRPAVTCRELEDSAWGSVWLYGNWREITRQMTTQERELAADAVARWSERIDPDEPQITGLRWWRDAGDFWRRLTPPGYGTEHA